MRDGWKFLPLSSVSSESKNIKWKDIAKDKQYRYIDLTSVSREMKSITEPQLINKDNAPSRAQRIIQTDDILFATTRPTLRRFCIVPTAYDGQICSTGYCVIRPNKEEILPSWIFYLLSSDLFYDYIEPLQTGATYPAVTDTDVRGYLAPIPSLAEQQRIVDILDEAFEKIDVLKANAEQNLQDAKALFQAALRKELKPKDGWKRVPLSSVSFGSKNIKWKDVSEDTQYEYIDLTSVDRGTKSITAPQQICKTNAPSRAQRIIQTDDVIFATTRPTLRRFCIIPADYDGQICSTGYCVIRPNKEVVLPSWIFYLLSSDLFYDYIEPLQTGANYPAVTDADVRGYVIPIPSLSEQQDIVSRLDTLNNHCKTLQTNCEKTIKLCTDLKQALLRKAFNGEL